MSRSKRTCSVSVGVKAVKSWVPTSAAAQASSSSRSMRWRHQSARPSSNGLALASGEDPVAVAARDARRGGRRTVGRGHARAHRDVGGKHRVHAAHVLVGHLARPRSSRPAPIAWTPASVLPATVSATGSRRTVASAASSSPCTVRSPGCAAQPRKPVPS